MRSIASCYNEHAIKVSDSYCSGPSNQPHISPNLVPSSPNTVKCIYKATIPSQRNLLITLAWCNNRLGHGLTINVSDTALKLNPNTHCLTKRKGSKTFRARGSKIEVIWDVSDARYMDGPEPSSVFSVIVLVDSQLCLSLGDMDHMNEQQNPTKPKFSLVSRSEVYVGTSSLYSTKAQFSDKGLAHDILIKCNEEETGKQKGMRNPELTVAIDEKKMVQVKRLRWNFRGNHIIFLDGLLIDMMWDLHDWLFNQTSGCAVFMFRTRSGLDCRLWFEEHMVKERDDEFSLLICACKNPH
ncbi:cytochrome P450 76A2-like [Hibiscus syriacus]|uniref:Cytochrome P450 76A2-like n=1 Tax=Hibiscus syriacus TaxID=106335 RepID=A0A6A3AFC1_HIBSY|nr:uncharacterized protein LOC120128631 [Hibiscus syriacus]KAE8702513.1 cytochrome P450 76A2-like [Hibiscus syriacus]